jgi:mitochondrial fission protein ELM1
MIASVPMTHAGKSAPAVVNAVNVKRVIVQLRAPKMKTRGDSVDGASHDLRMVGSPAIWSAQTKETKAIVGSLTNIQKARPANEMAPHTMSKGPSRHTLWGFRNETINTAQGTKPSISVVSEANPTCC